MNSTKNAASSFIYCNKELIKSFLVFGIIVSGAYHLRPVTSIFSHGQKPCNALSTVESYRLCPVVMRWSILSSDSNQACFAIVLEECGELQLVIRESSLACIWEKKGMTCYVESFFVTKGSLCIVKKYTATSWNVVVPKIQEILFEPNTYFGEEIIVQ